MDSVYTTHISYKWKSDAKETFLLNIVSKIYNYKHYRNHLIKHVLQNI